MPSKAAESLATLEPRVLPYEPSVPCARCARGVDPLRAACVTATDDGLLYFCERSCIEEYRAAEARHAAVRTTPSDSGVRHKSPSSRIQLETIARRVDPPPPTTPLWPLLAALLSLVAGHLPFSGSSRLAALTLAGVAAAFASRVPLTRREGGFSGWIAAPFAVSLLGLAALLDEQPRFLLAAGLGVALMWAREHLIEREEGRRSAARDELAARLAPQVRIGVAGERLDRPARTLRAGDVFTIEAPETVPVDALVVGGDADVLPYPEARETLVRVPGDGVLAGATLARGSLELRTLRTGRDRTLFGALEPHRAPALHRTLALAAQATQGAAPLIAVLVALAVAMPFAASAATYLGWIGAAVLAIPLLLGARAAHLPYRRASVDAAARGISFRDAAALELAGTIDTVALRLEGVLVSRAYTLAEVCSLSAGFDARRLLELALSAEVVAPEHGIARAIRSHAEPLGLRPQPLRRLAYTRGRGISALSDGEGPLVLGSREALLGAGVSVAVADREAHRAESAGARVVFLALGGHVRGLFVFEQQVRPEARVAMQQLFDLGLEVELVSGDHRTTVEAIARPLDIMHVKAELGGAQRTAEIQRLREGDARVAAIGLLPDDEGLLGAADLALCLDAAALAGERALTCASRDLRDAAQAFAVARAARRRARNLALLVCAGLLSALLAAVGVLPAVVAVALALLLELVAYTQHAARFRADAPRRR
jgi:P-type Cu+ transporter